MLIRRRWTANKHNYSHLELFAGSGGFGIGANENGFGTVYACDWEENSEQFYQNNFPDVPFDCTDVRNISLERINGLRTSRGLPELIRGELDVLSGGSPCVKLSASNTVDARDFAEENMLMIETLPKLVKDLQPKIAVFENSDRLLSKERAPLLMEYLASIQNLLPNYYFDVRVLNAKRYGAFQNRSRAIVILVRKDVLGDRSIPFFPNPEPINLAVQGVSALMPWVKEFSAGQFGDKFKSAEGRLFCTITASTCQKVKGADGLLRKISPLETKIVSGMTGYDYSGICETGVYKLLGNMIMHQLTKRLFKNFLNIL